MFFYYKYNNFSQSLFLFFSKKEFHACITEPTLFKIQMLYLVTQCPPVRTMLQLNNINPCKSILNTLPVISEYNDFQKNSRNDSTSEHVANVKSINYWQLKSQFAGNYVA